LLILTNWIEVDVGLAAATCRLVFGADFDELVELGSDSVGAGESLVGNLGGAFGGSLAAHGAVSILGAEDVSTSDATAASKGGREGNGWVGLLEDSGLSVEEVSGASSNNEGKGQDLEFHLK
jgi:hypothetical protein